MCPVVSVPKESCPVLELHGMYSQDRSVAAYDGAAYGDSPQNLDLKPR